MILVTGDAEATPALDDDQRYEAAQVTTCAAIQNAVDGTTTFDRQYVVEQLEDGTSQLTTAALMDGRQVDVRSVLHWDDGRLAWKVRELYVGGASVPVVEGDFEGD